MNNPSFNFPMSVRERIGGIIYIPLHCWVIPILVVLIDELSDKMNCGEAVLNLLIYAVGFLFCLLFMWKFLKKSFEDIFENKVRFFARVMSSFGLYYVLSAVVSWIVVAAVGDYELAINPNSANINALVRENFNVMAVMSVIFAPVVEESMFRGALFGTIRKKSRFWAYAVTIVFFAFYHLYAYFITDYSWQLWVYLLQYVPATFVLCRLYEKSGTIWCPIALHALINLVALYAAKLL
ncbi:MAG: CPBP family intramembrane metalloprotease [Oscillospiraceae bacterium]|nr:CPBP family intramembrane metalloprotease [Oscillospiraceae bacterium]